MLTGVCSGARRRTEDWMPDESAYARLSAAVVAGDREKVLAAVEAALDAGLSPLEVIENGLSPGMREIGERFARYEVFLPGLMLAAEAWERAMAVLEPRLRAAGEERRKAGTVVIGTVKDDVHSIGKNIVAAMLRMNGFEVADLGTDVVASRFLEKAEEVGADIVALSALMTTTMPGQKSVVEHMEARGVRDRYCVLVGGGCTTQGWADEIGADGWGRTASEAVDLALKAVSRKTEGAGP